MKHVLPILALAAASGVAAPALAQSGGSTYQAVAVGALEVPPNASPGYATVAIDIPGRQLFVDAMFRDLLGSTTAAHVHCCTSDAFTGTAPIAVPFTGFPTGVSAGEYSAAVNLGDDASYDPAFLAANGGTAASAAAALLAGMNANEAYVNFHTDAYPNGEIRGFVVAAPIPEPAEWAMLGIGLGGLLWMTRRRRQPEPGLAA